MYRFKSALLGVVLVACTAAVGVAQTARPYAEGPVVNISFIKIKPGMFDAYMKWVATERKQLMEEQKKAGLIVDYRVYQAQAQGPNDADLILTVTYKNWAAFDGLTDRTDALITRMGSSPQKASEMAISREAMRTVLGQQTIQELVLK
jgi:hypothetical protein